MYLSLPRYYFFIYTDKVMNSLKVRLKRIMNIIIYAKP